MSKTKNSTSELFKNEDEQQLFSSLTLFSTVVKCRTFCFSTLARPWTRRKWGKPTSCCPLCSKIVQSQKSVFLEKRTMNVESKLWTAVARCRFFVDGQWKIVDHTCEHIGTNKNWTESSRNILILDAPTLKPREGLDARSFSPAEIPEGPGCPKTESCYKNTGWGGPNDPPAGRGKPREPADPKTGSQSDKNCPYSRGRH